MPTTPLLEVERRALVSPDQVPALLAELKTAADYATEHRFVFDYARFVEQQGVDRRVRILNGQPEVIEKFRADINAPAREVVTPHADIASALAQLLSLGYTQAHVIARTIWRGTLGGVEFSLNAFHNIQQPGQIWCYLLEVEQMVPAHVVATAEAALANALQAHGLTALEGPSYNVWVNTCRDEAAAILTCTNPAATAAHIAPWLQPSDTLVI